MINFGQFIIAQTLILPLFIYVLISSEPSNKTVNPFILQRFQSLSAEKDSLDIIQHEWTLPMMEKRAENVLKKLIKQNIFVSILTNFIYIFWFYEFNSYFSQFFWAVSDNGRLVLPDEVMATCNHEFERNHYFSTGGRVYCLLVSRKMIQCSGLVNHSFRLFVTSAQVKTSGHM